MLSLLFTIFSSKDVISYVRKRAFSSHKNKGKDSHVKFFGQKKSKLTAKGNILKKIKALK